MVDPVHVVCPQCSTANRVPRERLPDGPTCGKCKKLLFEGHPVELDAAAFDRQLRSSDLPILVDFWAPWCGPCRAMAPQFERAARELEPAVRLAKVNTDVEQAVAGRYGIRSIPTLVLFRNGREVARQAGAMDASSLVRWVRSAAG
ncbi:MAG: thioredoxin TrxC [Burkholderiales bacterium]